MEQLIQIIASQQEGHENEPRYMIGEQLKDIASREPACIDILVQDLSVDGMKLEDAEKAFKKYADDNHGKAKCFCITPKIAEEILRKFYCLPESDASLSVEAKNDYIDIESFI